MKRKDACPGGGKGVLRNVVRRYAEWRLSAGVVRSSAERWLSALPAGAVRSSVERRLSLGGTLSGGCQQASCDLVERVVASTRRVIFR